MNDNKKTHKTQKYNICGSLTSTWSPPCLLSFSQTQGSAAQNEVLRGEPRLCTICPAEVTVHN